jgi:hypothetical protein
MSSTTDHDNVSSLVADVQLALYPVLAAEESGIPRQAFLSDHFATQS